jgi:hypothetical protein
MLARIGEAAMRDQLWSSHVHQANTAANSLVKDGAARLPYPIFTSLYYTVLYCTVLYGTVLYCTVLYCTVLCCTVLYCTVSCFAGWFTGCC